jgi:hypothetical protein
MNVRQLGSAELVVHIFAPAEGPDAVQCYDTLRSLWDSVRRQFGLDEVPFPGVGGELPPTLDAARPGVIAARAGDRRDQLSQVLFRWSHDVLILSAVLAPRVVTPDPWTELQRQWDAVAPVSATYYGVVKIFQGLLSTGRVPHAELRILARSLAPLVPDARTEPPWLDQGGVAGGGLAVWETGSVADERRERRLLVIGPPGKDDLLSAWTWSTGDAATTPLTRYLTHAAKIRYEYRVWAQDSASVRARRVRVSEHSRLVLQQLITTLGSPSLDQEAISKLLEPFYALELEVAALVDITGQLQQLRRTVEVALANISEYAEPSWGQPAMFSDDRRLGTRLVEQVSDDVTYLVAVKDGARNAIATAREALERRAAVLKQEQQEHQDRVSLLQAVVISGVVLCLTVVQALGYQVPLRGGVKPAAVAALCAGSVWLVVFVIRLAALPYLTASRRRTRWRLGEALAAGVALSAVGWALSSWIRLQLLHRHPSGAFTLTWTGLGLVIGAAVSWLAFSVRPRR